MLMWRLSFTYRARYSRVTYNKHWRSKKTLCDHEPMLVWWLLTCDKILLNASSHSCMALMSCTSKGGKKIMQVVIRENDEGLNDITALFLHYQKVLQKNDDNKGSQSKEWKRLRIQMTKGTSKRRYYNALIEEICFTFYRNGNGKGNLYLKLTKENRYNQHISMKISRFWDWLIMFKFYDSVEQQSILSKLGTGLIRGHMQFLFFCSEKRIFSDSLSCMRAL